jgi:hypothetical protein
MYDDQIIQYSPKKMDSGEKYVPLSKHIQVVSALDDGQSTVHIQIKFWLNQSTNSHNKMLDES